jgi:hypothetical protein
MAYGRSGMLRNSYATMPRRVFMVMQALFQVGAAPAVQRR